MRRIDPISKLFLLLLGPVAIGCAGDFGDDDDALNLDTGILESQSREIIGGKKEKHYKPVGFLAHPDGTEGCTGTLIKKNVVVTAAHCVATADGGTVSVDSIFFGLGHVDHPTQKLKVRKILRHPLYSPNGNPRYQHDVALLLLDSKAKDVTPAKVATMSKIDDDEAHADCHYSNIGYGDTRKGTFEDHQTQGWEPGQRKSAKQCTYRHDGQNIWSKGKKGGICWGDSGGPLMDGKKTHIFGVLADFGESQFECAKGNHAVFTSLSGERDFIDKALRAVKKIAKNDKSDGLAIPSESTLELDVYDYDVEDNDVETP